MSNEQRNFGRIQIIDERDDKYLAKDFLNTLPDIQLVSKYWYCDGWIGNQGNSPECTAYAWLAYLHDGPVIQENYFQKPLYNTTELYNKFRENDGITSSNYRGSTVRGGAKVLKKLGFVQEYRWAKTIEDIVKCLLVFGPIIVGTKWYSKMSSPDDRGIIKFDGNYSGGHAFLLNGIDLHKGLIRIKNSWGKSWGIAGHAFISIDDFGKLLSDQGEACIALETKLNYVPELSSIISEDTI